MINDLDIVQWDYLLSPEFEMVNSAGKPLTGGYIEVYIHGTRNKYYCASDFNGTLHPFQIPLDSLGSNIVLASPDNAYDVYVYNKYGSLIMSRYNVHCQGTGGGGGSYTGDKLFYGQYTAHNVAETASLSKTKGNINLDSDGYLQLKQGMSYHITVRGAFQVNDVTNTETTLNYIEYSTISPIKVDIDFTKADPQNFELSYDIYDLAEDMAYQVAFEQLNGMVTDLVVEVHSLSNLATTATFDYEAGDYISIVDNTISVTGINPEDYSTHSETYESIVTAIQLVTGIVTGIVPDNAATHDEVYEATVTAINFVTGIIPETQVQSDWDQTDDTDPSYIQNKPDLDIYATHDEVNTVSSILHEEINNIVTSIDLSDYTTHNEVNESITTAINFVTGAIPTPEPELPLVAGDGITITEYEDRVEIAANVTSIDGYATLNDVAESAVTSIQLVTGMIPDVSDYTTHDEVHEATVTAIEYVTGMIPEAQVQSDWTETDNTDPSYIQNKPNEYSLIAGQNIDITLDTVNREIVIAASATDLSGCATKEELQDAVELVTGMIPDVSDFTTNNDVHESIVTAIEYVTGIIPDAQVQSNWTETDNTDPSYIQNKPNEYTVVAGDNIGIMIDNNDLVISASGVDLSDYTTFEDVVAMVSGVTGLTEYGQFYASNITGAATMSRTKGTIEVTEDGKIKLKKGSSYHVTVRGRYNQTTAANTYGDISYIEYITGQSIHVNVDKTITEAQYFELSYDLYKLNSDSNYYVFFSMNGGTVNDLFIEIHSLDGIGGSGTGPVTGGTEYDAGWGIQILNNVISVNPSIIPVVTGFATKAELQDGLELVTGMIPDVSDFATEAELQDGLELVTGLIPDISNLATKEELQDGLEVVTGLIPTNYVTPEQLQDSVELVTGMIPDVSDYATNSDVFESSVTSIQLVTGLIPTNYASDEELQDAIELVTGLIPEAQVQSDWAQNDNTQVDYIKNKPVEYTVVAGQNIGITIDNNDLIISASGTDLSGYVTDEQLQDAVELVTGLIPTDYATDEELQDAVELVTGKIPELPDEEEVEFEEINLSDYALVSAIPDVSNLATKAELQDGLELVTGLIPTDYATDEDIQNAVEFVTGLIPDTSTFATHAEINNVSGAIVNEIPDVSDFVTEAQVTALIPEEEEVEFEEIDLSNYALASAIPDVSTLATKAELQDSLELVTGLIPDYTAGNCIDITSNVISWETTVGITDIQMVTALPANPVSSILYIIPEA